VVGFAQEGEWAGMLSRSIPASILKSSPVAFQSCEGRQGEARRKTMGFGRELGRMSSPQAEAQDKHFGDFSTGFRPTSATAKCQKTTRRRWSFGSLLILIS